jgi:pyroglutamyl-peptidase
MRILLTAYGPFRGVPVNITDQVSTDIKKEWRSDKHELLVLNMPVEWGAVERMLEETLKTYAPDIIVSLGHAASYTHFAIEKSYYNRAEGTDTRGKERMDGLIKRDGPPAYVTNIDTDKLGAHLRSKNIPAIVHDGSEGMSYLCNFAGYIVMHYLTSKKLTKPAFIFLHLPPEALPYSTLVLGVKETVLFLRKEAEAQKNTHSKKWVVMTNKFLS